jgi:serine/threonine-protein kinase
MILTLAIDGLFFNLFDPSPPRSDVWPQEFAMNSYELIRDMPFFSRFTDKEKKVFAGMEHAQIRFRPHESIIRENEETSSLYLLLAGNCIITKTLGKSAIRLAKLSPGEIFGEMSFFTRKTRRSNVIASGEVLVLKMDDHFFEKLSAKARDKLKNALIELLILRLESMNQAIMRISKLMRQ